MANAVYRALEQELAAGLNGVKFIEYAGTARLGDGTDASDVYVDPAKRMYPTFPLVNIYNEADGTTTRDQAVPWYPGLTMDNSQRHMEVFLVRFPFLNPKLKWVFGFTEIGLSAWNGVTPLQAGVANAAVVTYDKIYPHSVYPAGGLVIGYRGGWVRKANRRYLIPGNASLLDVSSPTDYRPGTGNSRWVRLSVSTTGAVTVTGGSEFTTGSANPRNYQPAAVEDGNLDLGAVLLVNGVSDLSATWGEIADIAPDIFTIPHEVEAGDGGDYRLVFSGTVNTALSAESDRLYHYGIPNYSAGQSATITAGVISLIGAPTITIAAESGTSDDVDSIGNASVGDTITVKAANGHTITLKHGTGNLEFNDSTDRVLSGNKALTLYNNNLTWVNTGW